VVPAVFRINAPKAPAALIAGALLPALAAAVAVAAPASATAIGPNQYFVADINGHVTSPAPIEMACYGPSFPGETGNPLPGQYAEVLPPATNAGAVGYTGSLGTAINVEIIYTQGTITRVVPVGTLTAYGTKLAIPTSLVLPCYGTGTAVFDPTPTSSTAKAADLTVDFIGQP
jgi:hypothetical protein